MTSRGDLEPGDFVVLKNLRIMCKVMHVFGDQLLIENDDLLKKEEVQIWYRIPGLEEQKLYRLLYG